MEFYGNLAVVCVGLAILLARPAAWVWKKYIIHLDIGATVKWLTVTAAGLLASFAGYNLINDNPLGPDQEEVVIPAVSSDQAFYAGLMKRLSEEDPRAPWFFLALRNRVLTHAREQHDYRYTPDQEQLRSLTIYLESFEEDLLVIDVKNALLAVSISFYQEGDDRELDIHFHLGYECADEALSRSKEKEDDDKEGTHKCPNCNGTGETGDGLADCINCDGTGVVEDLTPDHDDEASPPRRQILYFTASWCGPCKAFKRSEIPRLKQLGVSVGTEEADQFRVIDIDRNPKWANAYNISSVPTFVVIEDGKVIDRWTGARKNAKQLEQILN